MNRAEALALVKEYIQNKGLLNHMLSVESAMQFYAEKYDQDVEKWRITGLLHDFDWEIHPNADQHPKEGAPILREKGIPEDIIQAILAHGINTGVPRDTLMAKALYACDEITGLVTAVALVRPSKSLYDLKVKSIKKKWKDHAFAAGANRKEIEQAVQEFGVPLWEHVENVITAMKNIAPDIGLAGNISSDQIG
jgi:putative nucleotidyltransferase with HDIG domain